MDLENGDIMRTVGHDVTAFAAEIFLKDCVTAHAESFCLTYVASLSYLHSYHEPMKL